MAIFNETYTDSILSFNEEGVTPQALNEVVFDAIFTGILVANVAIWLTAAAGLIKSKKDYDTIKKAIDLYPKMHKDCKPLYKFKKKICKIAPYEDKPGEESVPKSVYEKFMRKFKLDYANKCICYFDDDDKLAMYYCYRVNNVNSNTTNYKTSMFITDDKYKKHEDYYFTFFLFNRKMQTNDTLEWAKKVVKEYKSYEGKKGD